MSQRILDLIPFVAEKLAEQKLVCYFDGGCSYGDGKGNHCLVGWLVNDNRKDAAASVEGGISTLLDIVPDALDERLPNITDKEHCILGAFQSYHDEEYYSTRLGYRNRIIENSPEMAELISKDLHEIYDYITSKYFG